MTTENLDQELIAELQNAMNAAAGNVRTRARDLTAQVQERVAARDRDAVNADIAARLVDQRHADRLAANTEEARQLAVILGLDVGQPVADGDGTPPPPPAPNQPDGFPPPAPAPQQDAPARPSLFDWIRSWTWIEWVCAILLAFVAIRWIAPATDQWVAGTVFNLDPDSETGDSSFWRSLVMTVWWILVVLAGFLIGGFIGSLIRSFVEGLREGRQQAQPDQPPAA